MDSESPISTSQNCYICLLIFSRCLLVCTFQVFNHVVAVHVNILRYYYYYSVSFVTLKWALEVNQGQRSRCTFISRAMVNIFVYRHPGPRSNRWDDTGHFHFRDLEMASSRSSKVKLFCGFWKADIYFLIVSHSKHGSTSNRLATIHDCNRWQTDSSLAIPTRGLLAMGRQKRH